MVQWWNIVGTVVAVLLAATVCLLAYITAKGMALYEVDETAKEARLRYNALSARPQEGAVPNPADDQEAEQGAGLFNFARNMFRVNKPPKETPPLSKTAEKSDNDAINLLSDM